MESMTGYGTAEGRVGKGRLFVEIKSINHRFNEINVKIPARMGVLEAHIRSRLTAVFPRGKVDVFFKEKEPLFGGVAVTIDVDIARQYQRLLRRMKQELGIDSDSKGQFLQIVGLDRVLRVEEAEGSYEKLWSQIGKLIDKAVSQVRQMRRREGAHIGRDQRKRLARLKALIVAIRRESERSLDSHLHRLRKKVATAAGTQVDEQRLAAEVSYLGGRQDIAEELLRLESHIKQYGGVMGESDQIGRKLDFLLQEMHREINTIGSKASDAKISQLVVDCKSELERLREQIQNVQ
ncbi:MAG: YicC family protein [Proteobacteria bacterium]|nr:YicC family protein [Pseudomonadota bacterium]